ncbi:hypothetical protein CC78DRAFT_539305 [Lojkania enalia]|uniref:Uncharacterized protein n=1 Tax=Lojkania enalia TaxID=147567 RepID=A0A9P4TQC7_9PLEO|nr:hypothetical protein CC78DRAFT_539305 [Didymosphaeria enalia]
MSPGSDARKRPPPIHVPPPPPPRTVPGPNAFALAEKSKQNLELIKQREAGNAPLDRETSSASQTLVTSPIDGSHLLQPEEQRKEGRGSVMTTLTNLMEAARSPRKSGGQPSSTSSRHAGGSATVRSRHSQRSRRSGTSSHLEEDEKTFRGEKESRTEQKLFKFMGQDTSNPDIPRKMDLTEACRTSEQTKSPKKKIFGLTLPAFKSSASNIPVPAIPEMPSKAAQVLGTGSIKQRHEYPRLTQAVRSDTSNSLPAKMYSQQSHSRHSAHHGPARPQKQSASRGIGSPGKRIHEEPAGVAEGSSLGISRPPTPPAKDTPPHAIGAVRSQKGPPLQFPNFARPSETIPTMGGNSPTKFRPYGAKEYAALIEGQPVASAQAQVAHVDDTHNGGGGNQSAPPLEGKSQHREPVMLRRERWSEEEPKQLSERYSGPQLPPAFYSPSASTFSLSLFEGGHPSKNTDRDRYLFAIPSKPRKKSTSTDSNYGTIDMIFQGEASEIDPTSTIGQKINAAIRRDTPSPLKRSNPAVQPEQSSSKLTDMLGSVTPSKAGYNQDFHPYCPSAVPSPLHRNLGQRMPPALSMMADASIVSNSHLNAEVSFDGTNVLHHFYMTNEHIDVLGRSMYDLIEDTKRAHLAENEEKHGETVSLLQERFEDIKTCIGYIGSSVEEASDQVVDKHHEVKLKLDGLLEYIKIEVAEPLAVQNQRVAAMGDDIKVLQKSVQELQKAVDEKSTTVPVPAQPYLGQSSFALPNHRSQPSLTGFYDLGNDSARDDRTRMPPTMHEGRGDGRYRYNGHHNWYRPNNNSRDNRDDAHHPFPSTSPYVNNVPAQFNGGFMGSYGGGYYPNNQSE